MAIENCHESYVAGLRLEFTTKSCCRASRGSKEFFVIFRQYLSFRPSETFPGSKIKEEMKAPFSALVNNLQTKDSNSSFAGKMI